jgi:hypothetical protein
MIGGYFLLTKIVIREMEPSPGCATGESVSNHPTTDVRRPAKVSLDCQNLPSFSLTNPANAQASIQAQRPDTQCEDLISSRMRREASAESQFGAALNGWRRTEFILIMRKTPSFRAGMQSAASEAGLNSASVAARCTEE